MSYSIKINGKNETIHEAHNKEDFTKAVEIFRLFDDSRIDLQETHEALAMMDREYLIKFYFSEKECIFDSYMFSCILGNYALIIKLGSKDGLWDLNPNKSYSYGNTTITPFAAICQQLELTKPHKKGPLDLFLRFSNYDLYKTDSDGKRYISDEATDFILQVELKKKNTVITLRKLYMKGEENCEFKDYSDIPKEIDDSCIIYEIMIFIQEHKFNIPFFFEECYNGEMRELPVENAGGSENIFYFLKNPNCKRIVRFGVDDIGYHIEDLIKLDEFNIGPNITINDSGLKFSSEHIQEIFVEFELLDENLADDLIDIIFLSFKDETTHFQKS
uniref:Uncharacterized protein n=1 Tax=viral metagenome TaxID=1070528 RepID=A0A6C0BDH0_9ZZZZ